MYGLYLNYNEYVSGGEIEDPSDRWSNRTPEHKDFNPRYLFLDRDLAGTFAHGLSDEEIFGEFEAGDIAYLLYVRYQTGDTFGYSTGNWHIIGAFKDLKEASKVEYKINNDEYEGYKPWTGYFERLESVEIDLILVR